MVPDKVPEPGDIRNYKTFEFRMNIVAEATNDVLFTKNSVSVSLSKCGNIVFKSFIFKVAKVNARTL